MNLQNVFYIVGIICMTLYILLLLVVIIFLFYIKKRITDFTEVVNKKLSLAKDVVKHPKEVAATVGAAVADASLTQAAKMLRSKKKKR